MKTIFLFFAVVISFAAHAASSYNSGNALSFNGNSSYVSFTNNDLGLGSGNKLTVMAWVKWNASSPAGNWANIITLNRNTASGDQGQFWFQHNSSNTRFEFAVQNASGSRVFVQNNTDLVIGQWYHIAGTYDGANVKLYVNGVFQNQTALTGNIAAYQSDYRFQIGRWAFSGNSYRYFNGLIDEVSVWNVALTQTQIQSMMCSKLSGTESGLKYYTRFSEASGTSITDLSGNGRTGTNNSASIVTSGAPVGDASIYASGVSSLSLRHNTTNDSIYVNGFSATPTAIVLYRIDTTMNVTTPPSGITSLATHHYYGVFIVNNSAVSYTVNLNYNGFPGQPAGQFARLAQRSNNASSSWNNLSASNNYTQKIISKTAQSGSYEYALAFSTISVLPIELVSFTAEEKEHYNSIQWSTASEQNNAYFQIEKSNDGIHFESIAKIEGAGNSNTTLEYAYNDVDIAAGVCYYRLKQVDFDGAFTYSNVRTIQRETTLQVHAYPNPCATTLQLSIPQESNIEMIRLRDLSGRVFLAFTPDAMNMQLDLSSYANGIYLLEVYQNNQIEIIKIVKQ